MVRETATGLAALPAPFSGGGAPPELPDLSVAVDEGPMRGDLRRQIMWLEYDYALACAARFPRPVPPVSPRRGPTILTSAELEAIRDELLAALAELRRES